MLQNRQGFEEGEGLFDTVGAPYLEEGAESLDSLGHDLLETLVVEPLFAVRIRIKQSRLRKPGGQLRKASQRIRNRVRQEKNKKYSALWGRVDSLHVAGDSESAAKLFKWSDINRRRLGNYGVSPPSRASSLVLEPH